MAIVPGDPNEPVPVQQTLPKWAQPTPADFLQAAAIMHAQGSFKVAGDDSGDTTYSKEKMSPGQVELWDRFHNNPYNQKLTPLQMDQARQDLLNSDIWKRAGRR